MVRARLSSSPVRAAAEAVCPQRWGKAPCRPIHRFWIFSAEGGPLDERRTCACGRRFATEKRRLGYARDLLARADAVRVPTLTAAPGVETLWPEDLVTSFGKVGVVPVGTPILHTPTAWFTGEQSDLEPLADRLKRTMVAARGIGVAANQVGAGIRAFVHGLSQCAPGVLINPVRVAASGTVTRPEGCLSLHLDGVRCDVTRWQKVTVVADLIDGRRIVAEADEMLARVLQHEMDHLEGVEYIQRTEGDVRQAVYAVMRAEGVPLDHMPPLGPETAIPEVTVTSPVLRSSERSGWPGRSQLAARREP